MANKTSFDEWKRMVDAFLCARIGLDSECLPDMPYYDWYADGVSAKNAASKAIRRAVEV